MGVIDCLCVWVSSIFVLTFFVIWTFEVLDINKV